MCGSVAGTRQIEIVEDATSNNAKSAFERGKAHLDALRGYSCMREEGGWPRLELIGLSGAELEGVLVIVICLLARFAL